MEVESVIGSKWRSTKAASTAEFTYENGRRYHAYRAGEYHMPNDEREMDRLDKQHQIFRFALEGKLFLAPLDVKTVRRVLDVGCGTGSWAVDLAEEMPNADVVGFDLSPIQPEVIPLNCRFHVDDVNSAWEFGGKFDFIHTRAMTPGIKNWPRYLQHVYNNLDSGGCIELHEVAVPAGCTKATSTPKPHYVEWSEGVVESGPKAGGFDFLAPQKMDALLQDAGFVDVTVRWMHWPVGTWAKGARNKEIGRWWAEDMRDVTKSTSAMFTRVLGWSQEEFDEYHLKIAEEIDRQEKHLWNEICFAYARKP